MPANKDRLYVGLHARTGAPQMPGKEDTYHWSLFIAPKNGTSATRFHAKVHYPDGPSGQPRWSYEESDTILAPIDDLLVLVCIAKIVNREKVESVLRETPLKGELADSRSRRGSYHHHETRSLESTDDERVDSAASCNSDARSVDSVPSTRSSVSAEAGSGSLPSSPSEMPRSRRVTFAEPEPTLSTVPEDAEDEDGDGGYMSARKASVAAFDDSIPAVVTIGPRKLVMTAGPRRSSVWVAEKCDGEWNCVEWVKDALAELEHKTAHGKGTSVIGYGQGGNVLGRAMVGWRAVRDAGIGYLEKKQKEGRWDSSGKVREGKWDAHAVPIFDLLRGLEVVA